MPRHYVEKVTDLRLHARGRLGLRPTAIPHYLGYLENVETPIAEEDWLRPGLADVWARLREWEAEHEVTEGPGVFDLPTVLVDDDGV